MRAIVLASVALAIASSPALGQDDQLATLDGSVADASGGVLAGARVTVTSGQLIGGSREAQTDGRGHFQLLALPPGRYEAVATAAGFRAVRYTAIELRPGLGHTLRFQLEIAGDAEEIIVRGEAIAVDVRRSAPATIIGRRLLETLPFDPRRNDNGYPGMAPGINRGVSYGGVQRFNAFTVDGTLATDPTSGSVNTTPSANWLEQVQAVSLGAGAAQGDYNGARVTAITRSGGNQFTALGEYVRTIPGWTGNNRGSLPDPLARTFKPIEIFERWTATLQAGGPVRREHLWFFSSLDYYRNAQRPFAFSTTPPGANEPRSINRDPRFLLKLTGALSRSLRLEGFVSVRTSETINSNAGPLVAPEALSTLRFPEQMRNARLTWIAGSRTLVEARYGRFWLDPVNGPTPPSTTSGPPSHFDRFTGIRSGNVATFSDVWQQVSSVQAGVTRQLRGTAPGSHQIQAGIEHEWVRENYTTGYPGGVAYRDNNGTPDIATFWPGASNRATQRRSSLFVQDAWH